MNILQRFGRIDSISPRQRKKLIWKLCDWVGFKDREFEETFYGFKYKGHTKNLIDRYVFFLGAYEKGMLDFIAQTLSSSKDKVFLDIGANVGHHSLFAAGMATKVFAFEPYEKVRKSLEEKIALNGLQNIVVVPYALGSTNEDLTFYEPADFNTGTGSFLKDFKPTNKDQGLVLKVRNGTELFTELGIKEISLIKLDTEGFEASVLNGLLPILEKTKPTMIVEFSPDSKRLFEEYPQVRDFLVKTYDMRVFNNPNKRNYKLRTWNFDSFGDVIFTSRPNP